ncbi:MAG: HAMP domain-containing sensor histidine kinase [Proteobacteria bacterium]|nr:HAMP domain-containing sensor histidine kinase [Pseudomonadota bacterium]
MPETQPHQPGFLKGLSFRLLLLTMFFVMIAEFLIWAPSISRFRKVYFEENIIRAHLSMLAVEIMPGEKIGKPLEEALLFHTAAYGIVVNSPDRRMLMVSKEMPPKVDLTIDITKGSFLSWIKDAFSTLAQDKNRILRIIGKSTKDPKVLVEVLIDEAPMRDAMWEYSRRILNLSIIISLFTASLVFVSLQWVMVRPMRRITKSMAMFRAAPEDVTRMIIPSQRSDEIGFAERELAVMQEELRAALQQKTRLAALGTAVAKVNHDLRNSLATAVLASDRLASIDDPEVKEVMPRLLNAIDRAVNLCSQTLNFVSDANLQPELSIFSLRDVVTEAGATVGSFAPEGASLEWENAVPEEIEIEADREHLFRILTNLGQNSIEAGADHLRIGAVLDGEWVSIDVADDGPGLAAEAKEKLFQPFAGSARDGGTGLGLVIVHDIARAHGGDVELLEAENATKGATFRIKLPARRDN